MGTALYVSPEQATGSPLTGSSDIYSLGVVAYECLSGEPPFMADQPLAIAIMHKHEPVPPLPPDVPRPVADLVYTMLAKAPEGRPVTAQHVADRADVIREARSRSGPIGPVTANLPVVPNFPPPDGNDFYNNGNDFYNDEPGWSPDPRPRRRALVLAGAGLAACGIIAIIVLLLTSSTTPAATIPGKGGHPTSPGQSASEAATPTTASLPASTVGGDATRTNLGTASETPSARRSASPTTSARQSSTSTQSSPPTGTSSSASATTSSGDPTGTPTGGGSPSPTTTGSPTGPVLPLAGDGTGG
jgi:eukaryotic-like serine/threonine-protein kinase